MKRIFALLLICLIVFIALRRQRIFLRDPLANVTRDGTAVGGVQVMINYTNDVLPPGRQQAASTASTSSKTGTRPPKSPPRNSPASRVSPA